MFTRAISENILRYVIFSLKKKKLPNNCNSYKTWVLKEYKHGAFISKPEASLTPSFSFEYENNPLSLIALFLKTTNIFILAIINVFLQKNTKTKKP